MLEHELKEIWRSSSETSRIKFEKSRLLIDFNGKMSRIEKSIRWRDIREISASIIGIPFFVYFAYEIPFPLTKFACVLGIIWFVFVIYKLKRSQKHKTNSDLSNSLKEQIKVQKIHLYEQKKLLNSVVYWYALPPFIMNVLFVIGLGDPADYEWTNYIADNILPLSTKMKIITLGGLFLFNAFIIWINKQAVKKDINPLIKEIERVEQQLKNQH